MATKHHISRASKLYFGDAYDPVLFATNERTGVQITPMTLVNYGLVAALDADALMIGATGAELPNAETVTYTTATDGTSPLDNAARPAVTTINTVDGNVVVWPLDVPRNITVTTSAAAAETVITVTGYDVYKQKMVEQMTIALGDSAVAGLKAFKYVYSIAIYSAGNIEGDTMTVGFGDVLGLPYRVTRKYEVMQAWFNDVLETTAPTVVVADTNTPTATTGDVRGTIDLNSAMNGSAVRLFMVADPETRTTLLGLAQYGG